MVLADTSVWIQHFRQGEPILADRLGDGLVLMHPFVMGRTGVRQPEEPGSDTVRPSSAASGEIGIKLRGASPDRRSRALGTRTGVG